MSPRESASGSEGTTENQTGSETTITSTAYLTLNLVPYQCLLAGSYIISCAHMHKRGSGLIKSRMERGMFCMLRLSMGVAIRTAYFLVILGYALIKKIKVIDGKTMD